MTPDATPPEPAPVAPPLSPEQVAALFADVRAATTDAPVGLLSRVQALPWAARGAMGVGLMLATGALLGTLTGIRDDLVANLPGLALVAVGGSVGILAATRPAGRPWTRAWKLALLLPVVLPSAALLPPFGAPLAVGTGTPMAAHLGCAVLGGLCAVAAGSVTLVLDRGAPGRLWRALGAAGGGGAAGYLATTLHCPSHDPVHLLLTHAGAGVWLAAAFSLLRSPRRPGAGPPGGA